MFNIVFENNTNHKVNKSLIEQITKELTNQEIELILTSNDEIQEINLTTRGLDKPTDVLSFPYDNMPNTPLGSIVISSDLVEEKSKLYNHGYDDEFALLYIHGLLHLLGYDHEIDNGEHRDKEEELIKKFNLPNSLIVRNSYSKEDI